DAVARLETHLRAELDERGAAEMHDELELPLAGVIATLEATGIAVDDEVLAGLDREHERRQTEVAESAFSHIDGDPINLGSPKQLQEVLYDRLGLPKGRRTKTGYSTNAETLIDLHEKTAHPFLTDLLAHRDVTTMRQIIDTRRRFISPTGRNHTTFNQNIAATGRLPSNHPTRGRAPDPLRLPRHRGLCGSDDRGLLADRDAHHGAPVRGPGADRGFPFGGGPAQLRGVARLRRDARRGRPRHAVEDQGRQL